MANRACVCRQGIPALFPTLLVQPILTPGAAVFLGGFPTVLWWHELDSPTWAGFCALINQNRANASLPSIGSLNPYLYPLIGTANFRDIVSGNNSYDGKLGYGAGAGYDLKQASVCPMCKPWRKHFRPVI